MPPLRTGQFLFSVKQKLTVCCNIWPKKLFENLESEGAKKYQNIGNFTFKDVKIKFLAMLISNKKFSFGIFMVENVQNIFMELDISLIS